MFLRWFATGVALVVVVLTPVFLLVRGPVEQRLLEVTTDNVRAISQTLARQIEQQVDEAYAELERVAARQSLEGFSPRSVEAALSEAQRASRFFMCLFASPVALADSRPSRASEGRGRQPASAIGQRSSGGVEPGDAGPTVSLSVPVRTAAGLVCGTVTGRIRLSDCAPLRVAVDTASAVTGYELIMVDGSGRAMIRSGAKGVPGGLAIEDWADNPLLISARQQGAVCQDFHYGRAHYLGAVERIAQTPWILLTQTPIDPIALRAESLALRSVWVFAALYSALFAAFLLYGYRVLSPIGKLTTALVRFGRDGEATVLEAARGPIEVRQAIEAFNRMSTERAQRELELLRNRRDLRGLASELAESEQRTRQNIARHLHDEVSQNLAAAKMRLELLNGNQSSEARQASLDVAIELLRESLRRTSELNQALAQPALQQLGLTEALGALATELEARHGKPVSCTGEVSVRVPPEVIDALYRGVRELVDEVFAASDPFRVAIRVEQVRAALHVSVAVGAEVERVLGQADAEGLVQESCLTTLRERLRRFGGQLFIDLGGDSPGSAADEIRSRVSVVTFWVPIVKEGG